jgi:transposase-like protein
MTATASEQQRNRRDSVRVTFAGKTFTLYELAEHLGIKVDALLSRVRNGWPESRLGEPVRPKSKLPPGAVADAAKRIADGESIVSVARGYGVHPSAIPQALKRLGWTPEAKP